jgi:hypothetical protein
LSPKRNLEAGKKSRRNQDYDDAKDEAFTSAPTPLSVSPTLNDVVEVQACNVILRRCKLGWEPVCIMKGIKPQKLMVIKPKKKLRLLTRSEGPGLAGSLKKFSSF